MPMLPDAGVGAVVLMIGRVAVGAVILMIGRVAVDRVSFGRAAAGCVSIVPPPSVLSSVAALPVCWNRAMLSDSCALR